MNSFIMVRVDDTGRQVHFEHTRSSHLHQTGGRAVLGIQKAFWRRIQMTAPILSLFSIQVEIDRLKILIETIYL